jgi:hypothetical protein
MFTQAPMRASRRQASNAAVPPMEWPTAATCAPSTPGNCASRGRRKRTSAASALTCPLGPCGLGVPSNTRPSMTAVPAKGWSMAATTNPWLASSSIHVV